MKEGARYEWDIPVMKASDTLMERVCYEFRCTHEELTGESRSRHLCDARGAYSILAREQKQTFHRIGIMLKRDHSSICNLIRRTESLIYVNDPIKETINRIRTKLFKQPKQL